VKTARCRAILPQLGAYVDGELTGALRMQVFRHLGGCEDCDHEVRAVGQLGGLLRGSMAGSGVVVGLDGLAAGVVSRVKAEDAQAWKATLGRGVADCRWLLAGAGSIFGSLATGAVVAVLLLFGPAPDREDSLAALLNNLGSPAGILFVVSAADGARGPVLMHVTSRSGPASRVAVQQAVFGGPTGPELAWALSNAVVREGELVELAAMPADEREDAEALMDAIRRRRRREALPLRGSPILVSQVRLVTSTGVSAKGL
jgi:anti-sigma factor RsiW